MQTNPSSVTIAIDGTQGVSALLQSPPNAHACYVMGHGAGAGMTHLFITDFANDLAQRGIATLRFQFPFMERGELIVATCAADTIFGDSGSGTACISVRPNSAKENEQGSITGQP